MSRLYLTLPSKSLMNYYPNNTMAWYTTKLPKVVEVDGDWEVGLTEITIPARIENVVVDECYFGQYIRDELIAKITLKPVEYTFGHFDLTQNIHLAYVYCDLLEHVTGGDTKAPLLRIVDFPNDYREGNVFHNLNFVLYIP